MLRRDVLRGLAATTGAVSVSSAPASADSHWPWQTTSDDPDHLGAKPDHVTLSFPRDLIERYRPLLEIRHLNVRPAKQYAWLATSPEYNHDVYCYWTWYTHQEGLTAKDSHFGDREPLYCFVDKSTGDVEFVVYSAYHWMANRALPTLHQETHPQLRVASRWHHYILTGEKGQFVDVDPLDNVFEDWLRNGWAEALAVGAAQDPALLKTRESWWRRGTGRAFGINTNEVLAKAYLGLNVRGAGDTDLE